MDDHLLTRIKRAVLSGRYVMTDKAGIELDADGLDESDAAESILNARRIEKTIVSTSSRRQERREYLHVICSPNFAGLVIYTKGKLRIVDGEDTYYILISAKPRRKIESK